ncbi:MAG: glycosyltransferase [Vicinamibacterales bacterium]
MRLSVVVTIVDARDALIRCLNALAAQQDPPELEVIVPWDDSVPDVPAIAARFPAFTFLAMGSVATRRLKTSASGQHELFDRRRAAGLAQTRGEVIAMLEDRGVPRPDWARTLMTLHERMPHAAIGGAIENGRDAALNWAVYYCDFHRYQRPFTAGPSPYVSDINVGYKRRALEQTRDLWRTRYHETTVNWALRRAGETLYVTPEIAVDQFRSTLRLGSLIDERIAWGRLFAHTRAREAAFPRRVGLAVLAPLLPALLFARHTRMQMKKGVNWQRFLQASPVVFILLVAWSLGETLGYITAEP